MSQGQTPLRSWTRRSSRIRALNPLASPTFMNNSLVLSRAPHRKILALLRWARHPSFPAALALLALVHLNRSPESISSLPGSDPSSTAPDSPRAKDAQGRTLFSLNCAHCHGEDARGDEGPDLHALKKSDARIRQIITQGIKGEMPKFNTKFSNAEVEALVAYLRTLKS